MSCKVGGIEVQTTKKSYKFTCKALSCKSSPIKTSEQGLSKYSFIARTGQIVCDVLPIMRNIPLRKGSGFEAFISSLTCWGNAGDGINLTSCVVKCSLGLNLVLRVISLILRKPKKAGVNAADAHIILLFECDLGKKRG